MLACLREGKGGVYVEVHAVPGAKKTGLEYDSFGRRLRIKINAPPVEGRANREVLDYFSKLFGDCVLAAGASSRKKTVYFPEKTLEAVSAALEAALSKRG